MVKHTVVLRLEMRIARRTVTMGRMMVRILWWMTIELLWGLVSVIALRLMSDLWR